MPLFRLLLLLLHLGLVGLLLLLVLGRQLAAAL
jgi:hypothetical protein